MPLSRHDCELDLHATRVDGPLPAWKPAAAPREPDKVPLLLRGELAHGLPEVYDDRVLLVVILVRVVLCIAIQVLYVDRGVTTNKSQHVPPATES